MLDKSIFAKLPRATEGPRGGSSGNFWAPGRGCPGVGRCDLQGSGGLLGTS
jgi:hypothetical protein